MADNEVNIVITATDKASQVLVALQRTFSAVTGEVAKVTGAYIAYGDQVRQLSLFVGTSNEQTSRMIQLADDAFVSFETLRMASKKMSQDGIMPTVENIGKLSDQFLALQPGVARSQFLIDHFGRSGVEMAKIMELGSKKITQMNKAIEDGLIIDDKKMASIVKTKQALDQFNDSIDAMKYDIAAKLLDIFQKMSPEMQKVVLVMGVVGNSGMLNSLAQMAIILGNIGKLGSLGTMLSSIGAGFTTMAAGAWAALAPLIPLAAALALLYITIQKFGPDAWKSLQMLGAIWTQPFMSNEDAKQSMIDRGLISPNAGQSLEDYKNGKPAPALGGGGSLLSYSSAPRDLQGATFVYSPAVSIADRQEAQTKLMPFIEAALRQFNSPGK